MCGKKDPLFYTADELSLSLHGQEKGDKRGTLFPAKRTIAILVVGWILANSSIPSVPGTSPLPTLVFWSKIIAQLVGVYVENTYPRNRDEMDPKAPLRMLRPLPNEIDARNVTDISAKVREHWPHQPIVIRAAAQSRPDMFHDMLDYDVARLEELYNDTEVAVFTQMANVKSAVKMPFNEYTRSMTDKSRRLYARAIPDYHQLVPTNVDFGWLSELLGVQKLTLLLTKIMGRGHGNGVFFVSSDHVWSGAHCDVGTSAFIMLQGRKRWVFYGPSETPFLYPYGQFRNVAFSAGVDVLRPDMKERPLFAQARGYEVIIEPGDMLIFPSMWWHAVENLDKQTVGVDIPVIDVFGSFRRNMPFTLATVLNPKLIFTSLTAFVKGRNLRDVFFMGYFKSDESSNGN